MNKNLVLLVLSAFLLMEVACASKTEQGDIGKKSSTDADNTARNSRDRDRGHSKIRRKTKLIGRSRRLSARLWLEIARCLRMPTT